MVTIYDPETKWEYVLPTDERHVVPSGFVNLRVDTVGAGVTQITYNVGALRVTVTSPVKALLLQPRDDGGYTITENHTADLADQIVFVAMKHEKRPPVRNDRDWQ